MRLCGWNRKFLSRVGKDILLKAMVQATPSFMMSIFLMPISLCLEIERIMNSFSEVGIIKRGKELIGLLGIAFVCLKMGGGGGSSRVGFQGSA